MHDLRTEQNIYHTEGRQQRIGDTRYYRAANRIALKVAGVVVITSLLIGGYMWYQYEMTKAYQTKQQKLDEVRAQLIAVQQANNVPSYTITITQK